MTRRRRQQPSSKPTPANRLNVPPLRTCRTLQHTLRRRRGTRDASCRKTCDHESPQVKGPPPPGPGVQSRHVACRHSTAVALRRSAVSAVSASALDLVVRNAGARAYIHSASSGWRSHGARDPPHSNNNDNNFCDNAHRFTPTFALGGTAAPRRAATRRPRTDGKTTRRKPGSPGRHGSHP